jgi:hypothetical protein
MTGTKNFDNTNFALASPDGTRAGANGLLGPLPPGDGTELLADLEGRLWVRVVGGIAPPGFPNKVQASAAALTTSELIQLGACKLSTISGFVDTAAAAYYLQIFDLAAPPVANDVPIQVIPVGSLSEWSWSPDLWEFALGLAIGLSTTPLLYTAAPALAFWNAEVYTP